MSKMQTQRDRNKAVRGLLRRWGQVADTCRGLHGQLEMYERLREDARRLSAAHADGLRHEAPGDGDPAARAAARAKRLEAEYAGAMERLIGRLEEEMRLGAVVDELLCALSDRDRELVRLRYAEGRSWVAVALRLGCCEQHARRRDTEVVERLAECVEVG